MDRLHRFRVPGEADASLILRDGDETREVFDWYRARGRIVAGTYGSMCDQVFNAWAKDVNKGLTSLMTAADTATVTALNLRAQARHIDAGTIDTSQAAALLRAGQRVYVGDTIVTRLNRRRMTVRGGRDFVKNGDTWTVTKILPGEGVVARHTRHRGRIRLPADYLAAQCELGYASTIHRAQGMTVDTSHALAALTLTQLHTLTRLAASHRATAREALKAADAAFTHLPAPVTTRAGHTHPAWDQRPMGELTRRDLAAQLALARTQIRRAQTSQTPLSDTARHVMADLARESRLRRALHWRDAAREDFQREQATTSTTSLGQVRRTLTTRRTATADRRRSACAALARADAVSDKLHAELRFRERLPDHAPHRPHHRGAVPDWVADSHALTHPDTPEHWAGHLAERHRILARSLADRSHTLADFPPAWVRPLGIRRRPALSAPSRVGHHRRSGGTVAHPPRHHRRPRTGCASRRS
ncbi:hypothetical protein [Streptomyces sp. NPDC058434]|uniref:hypothetical protein n=1 Tax=Streptomyces sp. NPDC058434 TaxID=3346498 RepID=UPI003646C9BB